MSRRWAVSCADGALAQTQHSHPSTAGMNKAASLAQVATYTVWDWFHTWDKVCSVLLQGEVGELLSLIKSLDLLFGTGAGDHVSHAVDNYLGVRHLKTKTTGGTRKIVYAAGVPERFFLKFHGYYAGLLVRMRMALDGRGSKSFADLKVIGEQLTSLTMLASGLILSSVLTTYVQPGGLLLQSDALPWKKLRFACDLAQKHLPAMQSALRVALLLLRLRLYLRPFLTKKELVCFTWAYMPVFGKWFPRFAQKFVALEDGYLDGCDLVVATGLKPGQFAAHPTCQCLHLPQRQPGTSHMARGGGVLAKNTMSLRLAKRNMSILVPYWVGKTDIPSDRLSI